MAWMYVVAVKRFAHLEIAKKQKNACKSCIFSAREPCFSAKTACFSSVDFTSACC
jgi:hypothetical protein